MSAWTQLTFFPYTRFSKPLRVNGDEFIVVSDKDGIYTYKVSNDQWTKIIDFEPTFECLLHDAVYDAHNQFVYISNSARKLLRVDLNNKCFHELCTNRASGDFGRFPTMINTNEDIHIIGTSGKHLIFHKDCKQITEKHIFEEDLWGHTLIQMNATKSLLLINRHSPSWYEYTLSDNKWNKSHFNPKIKYIEFSAIVKTKNERYIIILGGKMDKLGTATNLIYVYDLKNKHLSISSIKCPPIGIEFIGLFKGILVYNEDHDDCLTFGFVRECFKDLILEGVQYLPHYMVQLIGRYVSNEEIHLLCGHAHGHWKINVDAILECQTNT